MCTHGKFVTNKYTGQRLYVKCGHCHSCQIDKANKNFARIMNHEADQKYFRVFITLNYANQALPYILLSDYDLMSDSVDVWRDLKVYHYRKGKVRRTIRKIEPHIIGSFNIDQYSRKVGYSVNFDGLQKPTKFTHDTAVSVIFSKDFTDFIKRFKLVMKRHYNLNLYRNGFFSYFRAAEYGPTTGRAHFHAILDFPPSYRQYYAQIRRAIIATWPFCSVRQLVRNISIANTCQSYVSAYTVRPAEYPDFLRIRGISQKASFSRHFGFGRKEFSPTAVVASVLGHSYTYHYQSIDSEKRPVSVIGLLPVYVMRYYFPKLKGSFKLDSVSLRSILKTGNALPYIRTLDMDYREAFAFSKKIRICAQRLGMSLYDYADLYVKAINGYTSFLQMYDYVNNYSLHPTEFYKDFSDCYIPHTCHVKVGITDIDISKCNHNPNTFTLTLQQDKDKELKYEERVKKVKFNDYCSSLQPEYYTCNLNNV